MSGAPGFPSYILIVRPLKFAFLATNFFQNVPGCPVLCDKYGSIPTSVSGSSAISTTTRALMNPSRLMKL